MRLWRSALVVDLWPSTRTSRFRPSRSATSSRSSRTRTPNDSSMPYKSSKVTFHFKFSNLLKYSIICFIQHFTGIEMKLRNLFSFVWKTHTFHNIELKLFILHPQLRKTWKFYNKRRFDFQALSCQALRPRTRCVSTSKGRWSASGTRKSRRRTHSIMTSSTHCSCGSC